MLLLDSDTAHQDAPATEAARRDLEERDEQRGKPDVFYGFLLVRHKGCFMHDFDGFGFKRQQEFQRIVTRAPGTRYPAPAV